MSAAGPDTVRNRIFWLLRVNLSFNFRLAGLCLLFSKLWLYFLTYKPVHKLKLMLSLGRIDYHTWGIGPDFHTLMRWYTRRYGGNQLPLSVRFTI